MTDGPSSPDIAPPAELPPTGPQAPAPGAGPNPADAVARETMVGRIESVLGGPPADASPSERTDAIAAAARISPDAVPPSTDAAAAKGHEVKPSDGSEPGADGTAKDAAAAKAPEPTQPALAKQQMAEMARAIVEAQQATKAAEAAWTNMPFEEKVVYLSSNEVAYENALALAEKAGNTELQTKLAEALAAIREQRGVLMQKDKRPIEYRISEAKSLRTNAETQLKQAKTSKDPKDPKAIEAAQARYDGASRYAQIVETENKRSLKKLLFQLLVALGIMAVTEVGGEVKEGATSTGQK